MRDGIYRVWFKGPNGTSAGAMAFRGGDILGSDAAFAFVGRYQRVLGRVEGEILFTRLRPGQQTQGLPDRDSFHLILSGTPHGEVAALRGTVAEDPSYYLLCELAKASEL